MFTPVIECRFVTPTSFWISTGSGELYMSLRVLVVPLAGQIRNRVQPPPRCSRFCGSRQARLAVQVGCKAWRDVRTRRPRVVPLEPHHERVGRFGYNAAAHSCAEGDTMDFEFDVF